MGKLKRKEWLKTTKKMLSVALLSALVVTTIPTIQADAAAKPKLNKKKVTIRVGKKYTLKVVNKIKGSKYTWKSNKKKVATVTKKGVVKGKKKGNAVITCTVKAPSKTYKLTCNVKVKKAAATTKPTPTPTVNTSATVSTQSELESALKNETLTSILLKTDAESKFSIPAGTYSKKTLTVNAPNADVENEGIFKEVKIQEIKASTWTEKAKGNILRLLDKSIRVIIEKTAQVKEIIAEGSDSAVNLEVEGTLTKLTIKKKTKIEIIGSNKKLISMEVTSEAKGTEIISEVSVNARLNADTELTLKKGAEGSKIDQKVASISLVIENQTGEPLTLTTPSGNQTVSAGSKVTIEAKGDTTTTTTPGTGGGGGNGGSTSTDTTPDNTETPGPDQTTATMSVSFGTQTGATYEDSTKTLTVMNNIDNIEATITVTNGKAGTIEVATGKGINTANKIITTTTDKAAHMYHAKFNITVNELDNTSKITFTANEATGIDPNNNSITIIVKNGNQEEAKKEFNVVSGASVTDNTAENITNKKILTLSAVSVSGNAVKWTLSGIKSGENDLKDKTLVVTITGTAIKFTNVNSQKTTKENVSTQDITNYTGNATIDFEYLGDEKGKNEWGNETTIGIKIKETQEDFFKVTIKKADEKNQG